MSGDAKNIWTGWRTGQLARVLTDHKRSIWDALVVGCCGLAAAEHEVAEAHFLQRTGLQHPLVDSFEAAAEGHQAATGHGRRLTHAARPATYRG